MNERKLTVYSIQYTVYSIQYTVYTNYSLPYMTVYKGGYRKRMS